jgi:hypothetical protein
VKASYTKPEDSEQDPKYREIQLKETTMKSYSTFASRIFVLRKEGFYPSVIQATKVVSRMAVVHQWSVSESNCAVNILINGLPSFEKADELYSSESGLNPYSTLSGNDLDVLRNFIIWYSSNRDPSDIRAFVTVDLNTGFSLVVTER